MPIKNVNPEQAIKRISDMLAIQSNIDAHEDLRKAAALYRNTVPYTGTAISVPIQNAELLVSALDEIKDVIDGTISVG